jgi:hypothetical protein
MRSKIWVLASPDPIAGLHFRPKLLHLPVGPLLLPFSRKASWILSHALYFPALCIACILSILYGRPLALVLRPRGGRPEYVCSQELRSAPRTRTGTDGGPKDNPNGPYVEISGYSFIGWGVIAVNDPMVIAHEFSHVENWLGSYTHNKLAFNIVPLMVAGIFIAPLMGLGPLSFALSLTLVLTFSLMAFVKVFH